MVISNLFPNDYFMPLNVAENISCLFFFKKSLSREYADVRKEQEL